MSEAAPSPDAADEPDSVEFTGSLKWLGVDRQAAKSKTTANAAIKHLKIFIINNLPLSLKFFASIVKKLFFCHTFIF